MNDKKSILPIVIAAVIALIITGILRLLMPTGSANDSTFSKKELSMPDIPLMMQKIEKKKAEAQVLVVTKNIKIDEKIMLDSATWKKWPLDAMQAHFIAKDEKGKPLNNVTDYANSLKMWAKNDIPSGVPLTISMLTSEDPVKKREIEKKKKEEELLKKQQEEKSNSFIKKGMRAVTFSIDQKSASSSNMLSPGDLVDVLIMEQRGDRVRSYKYKALKILAIDGMTRFENKKEAGGSGIFGNVNLGAVGGLLAPKNVTLEVKEEMVETMLQQSGNTGIILSLRSQSEEVEDDENGDYSDYSEIDRRKSAILQSMIDAGRTSASSLMLEEKNNKEFQEKKISSLIGSMNAISKDGNREMLLKENGRKEDMAMLMTSLGSVGIEDARKQLSKKKNEEIDLSTLMESMNSIASRADTSTKWKSKGKSKTNGEKEEKVVAIYRKLTVDGVAFDGEGNKITAHASNDSYSGDSGFSSSNGAASSGGGSSSKPSKKK